MKKTKRNPLGTNLVTVTKKEVLDYLDKKYDARPDDNGFIVLRNLIASSTIETMTIEPTRGDGLNCGCIFECYVRNAVLGERNPSYKTNGVDLTYKEAVQADRVSQWVSFGLVKGYDYEIKFATSRSSASLGYSRTNHYIIGFEKGIAILEKEALNLFKKGKGALRKTFIRQPKKEDDKDYKKKGKR